MKIEKIELQKFIADEDNVFAKADKSEIYGNEMYLGCNDRIENYIEITKEEAEEISDKLKIENQ